jgi:microfibrillar-associated protein 1
MSSKRMTANTVKAPRYRPGKAIAEDSSSDSEASDAEPEPTPQPPSKPTPKYTSAGGIASNVGKLDLNERRKRATQAEAARVEAEKALRAKEEEGFVTEESEEEEGSEEGSEEDSEEEESESEEEAPRRVLLRPTFIKKDKRNASVTAVEDTRPDEEKLAEEEARRKAAADEIVEEQIRKDLAAKAAGKKHWDDEEDDADDVDDTDDLDPEAEHAAWKLRELKRIKRDREAIEEREREREEIERRKNLTEEERKAEDDEFLAKQKEEKDSKGKMSYMQKYYHKGAFFQDDLKAEGLDRRDIMGSKYADDVQNRELLPQALQMRDMTKLGKKGATKYKDLKTEDTGEWGQFDDRRPRQGGFGADERFMPDRDRGGASGANSQPVAERRKVVTGVPEGPRAMREDVRRDREGGDTYRPNVDRRERRSRSRSRSRSPRRDHYHDDRSRRKRSSSRDCERYESDKRRRVDSR